MATGMDLSRQCRRPRKPAYQMRNLERYSVLSVITMEELVITVLKEEDIFQRKVNIIVHHVSGAGNFNTSHYTKNIVEKAGDEMYAEVYKVCEIGTVYETKPYNITNCEYILHGICIPWGTEHEQDNAEEIARDFVFEVLETAHKLKATSIAFPAIGTGVLNFPFTKVADILFEEVDRFSSTHKNTQLKDVRFVIYNARYNETIVKAFEKHLKLGIDEETSEPTKSVLSTTALISLKRCMELDFTEADGKSRPFQIGVHYPDNWTPKQQENLPVVVKLETRDVQKEFNEVVKKCNLTEHQPTSICRIQNFNMYQLYMVQRLRMMEEDMFNRDDQVEHLHLLGYAKEDERDHIIKCGFDMTKHKLAGKHGTGLYFFKKFDDIAATIGTFQFVVQCRVFVGRITKGEQGMLAPPLKDNANYYHSTVDDVDDPQVFVIYNDLHVLPEYIISMQP